MSGTLPRAEAAGLLLSGSNPLSFRAPTDKGGDSSNHGLQDHCETLNRIIVYLIYLTKRSIWVTRFPS